MIYFSLSPPIPNQFRSTNRNQFEFRYSAESKKKPKNPQEQQKSTKAKIKKEKIKKPGLKYIPRHATEDRTLLRDATRIYLPNLLVYSI